MRVLLALLIADVGATILRLVVDRAIPGFMTDESFRNSIDPLGNVLFIALLAIIITQVRIFRLLSIHTIISIIGFFTSVVLISFIAMVMYEYLGFGLELLALIGTIGYYPAGADVPFSYGVQLWIMSSLVPIVVGLILGALLRRLGLKPALGDGARSKQSS